jgi:hypothetical protein
MSAEVGADIESLCTKCGDVWHVVVAKVGDKIAKVQCKQCSGLHRFKPPGGQAKAKAAPRKASKRRTGTAAAAPPPDQPVIEPDLSRPARPYRIDQTYEPGDRIEHPTFGDGVVESAVTPGKIDVFFPGGRKVLASAKPASTLAPADRSGPTVAYSEESE